MRAVIVAVGLAACGRVGFDATVDAQIDAHIGGSASAIGTAPVQQVGANYSGGATYSAQLPFPPTAGDVLLAITGVDGAKVSSLNSGGVTWTQVVGEENGTYYAQLWYGYVTASGASRNVTSTLAGSGAGVCDAELLVLEWNGVNASGATDGTNVSSGSSTNQPTETVTPAAGANRLLIAVDRTSCPGAGTLTGNSTGWTEIPSPDACRFDAAYEVVASTSGSYVDDFTWNGSAQPYATVIAAFPP